MDQRKNIFNLNEQADNKNDDHLASQDSEVQEDGPERNVEENKQQNAVFRNPYVQGTPLVNSDSFWQVDEHEETSVEPPSDDTFETGDFTKRAAKITWVATSAFTIISAAILLFAFSQTAILAERVAYLPRPFNWFGFTCICIIWIAIIAASSRIVLGLARLRETPGISLSAVSTLNDRLTNRENGLKAKKIYKEKIRDFLANYPTDEKQQRLLQRAGNEAPVQFLKRCENLLREESGNANAWLQEVKHQFIDDLDKAAVKIIRSTALEVGCATALSPRGSIDALIVLTQCYRLVNQLCSLYGVRPSGLAACYIFFKIFLATTLAAGADRAAEEVESQITEGLAQSMNMAVAACTAKFGVKAGEGAVNALFVRRIGNQLKASLSPIRE
ncbi:MAG: DUF697 domain-containing protein [Pirellulales bacterium]